MKQLGIPKGTRDFLPEQVAKRFYITDLIRKRFELFGFQPIETPAMENLSTLTGKYGAEGDQLLFRILNNRLYESKDKNLIRSEFEKILQGPINSEYISERALRYDLTVPLARFVVNHANDLVIPFKRYHIAPVWRGDRPQKGRYREFVQCDADIIGSDSLLGEIELIEIFQDVFDSLGLKVEILLNNRKILSALCRIIDEEKNFYQIVAIVDKIDKTGKENASTELSGLGLSQYKIDKLFTFIENNDLDLLANEFKNDPLGESGIKELKKVMSTTKSKSVKLDLSLARGITYYTGIIYEVICKEVKIGSIASGGRYDDLTKLFGGQKYSGVGISFGIDRIYDVLNELDRYPEQLGQTTFAMFVNFGEKTERLVLDCLRDLRSNNISSELYPDEAKVEKQLKFAKKKKIAFTILISEEEVNSNQARIKNMTTGEVIRTEISGIAAFLKRPKPI